MSKYRIGHVTFHYFPVVGGQEIYIKNLMGILESKGYDNVVYQPATATANAFTKGMDKRVRFVLSLPFLNRYIKDFKKITFNLFLLTKIFGFIKDDVIIVHYAFHSWPLFLFRKKVIVLSHGVEWDLRYLAKSDRMHVQIAEKTFNYFKLVVNDSHYLRVMGMQVLPGEHFFEELSPGKWFIPNCVSNTKFNENGEAFSWMEGRKFILVPRQITEDRGILLAIEAFALMAANYPDTDLLITGAIKQEGYKEKCDALIAKLGMEKRVFWNHSVSNDLIPQFYRSALLTVIPTLRREGTSLSALEAMSCKCPVVSTNVAGLADLPTKQAEADANSLSGAMLEVLANRNEYMQQQQNAVVKIFNEDNWGTAWLAVVEKVLSTSKKVK